MSDHGISAAARRVQRHLIELFLAAMEHPQGRTAIDWLWLYFRVCEVRGTLMIPMADLAEAGSAAALPAADPRAALAPLVGPGGPLRLRAAGGGGAPAGADPPGGWDDACPVELWPAVGAGMEELRRQVGAYAQVLAELRAIDRTTARRPPLHDAMLRAGLCFNAALFFEAHEYLEGVWWAEPAGPVRRFLQGIIQISVGFHHAVRGSYEGALNQLAKGLDKTAGFRGEVLGLDCDDFLPRVQAVHQAIAGRGRSGMQAVSPAELPRMRLFVSAKPMRADAESEAGKGGQ